MADKPRCEEDVLMFLHCRRCVEEWKAEALEAAGQSPASYARLSVGWTALGLKVMCHRHGVNIVHVDFEGRQHPADMSDDGLFEAPDKRKLN
jgi:hypothetical protein